MHFADKEELLVSGFADLRKELNAQLRSGSGNGKPLGFARGLIEHVHEHQRLFRAFVGKRSGQTVQKQFRRMLLELVKEDLAHMPVGGDLPREAAVHYLAGGLLELLTWWLDGNSSVAPDAVESMFHRMSASALQTLRK